MAVPVQLEELQAAIAEARESAAQAVRDRDLAQGAITEAIAAFNASWPGLSASRLEAAQRLEPLRQSLRTCCDGLPDDIVTSTADLLASLKVGLLSVFVVPEHAPCWLFGDVSSQAWMRAVLTQLGASSRCEKPSGRAVMGCRTTFCAALLMFWCR